MESSLSIATSLKSENNLLPDENVYSRYDEAIAGIDDDLQTAVSHQEAKEEGRRALSAVSVGHFHHFIIIITENHPSFLHDIQCIS